MAAPPARFDKQSRLVAVAREIAINHKSIQDILKEYEISTEEWETLQDDPEFSRILQSEIVDWQSAQNTKERTRLKSAALLEMWLEEANARLWDPKEGLSAKVELAKLIEKMSGISATNTAADAGGGFKITINIGEGQQLKFEKEVTPKVIEGEAG